MLQGMIKHIDMTHPNMYEHPMLWLCTMLSSAGSGTLALCQRSLPIIVTVLHEGCNMFVVLSCLSSRVSNTYLCIWEVYLCIMTVRYKSDLCVVLRLLLGAGHSLQEAAMKHLIGTFNYIEWLSKLEISVVLCFLQGAVQSLQQGVGHSGRHEVPTFRDLYLLTPSGQATELCALGGPQGQAWL
jgi:hypothetical protein